MSVRGRRRLLGLLYRALLLLYPRRFRQRFGEDQLAAFLDELDDAERRGGLLGLAVAWLRALTDVPRHALGERLATFRRRKPGRSPRAPRKGRQTMSTIVQDLRFAARAIRRNPGFATAAVLTLGLGVGATTAVFSVLDAVVLRPLPYEEPDRLVRIWERTPRGELFATSQPNYLDFSARASSFADMAAYGFVDLDLIGDGEPQRLKIRAATASLFDVLGARPAVGRTFTAAEDRPGGERRLVLLSHRLWQGRFGSDRRVVGRTILLGGAPHLIVGVMPQGFEFPDAPDAWVPLAPDPSGNRGDHQIAAIGRLRAGVTHAQARAELAAIAERLGEEHPLSNGGWSVELAAFRDWIIGPQVARAMLVLLGAVGLLLLMACANVSNLLIARATGRGSEIAIRTALGASRGRIVQQLLTESLLLAALGSAVGLSVAFGALPMIRELAPAGIPRIETVSLDGTAFTFAILVSLSTALIFGTAPALHATRQLHGRLREGTRVAGSSGRRLQGLLVVGQLAMATTLLIAAGLTTRSLLALVSIDPGFDVRDVLAVPISLTAERYDGAARIRFMEEAEERLAALPGVTAVGATNILPLSGSGTGIEISIEGRPPSRPEDILFPAWRAVTPGFFAATDLQLIEGRSLDMRTDWREPWPLVVSERLARELWPGEAVLGRRVSLGNNTTDWQTIVGVVSDVRDLSLDNEPEPTVYFPFPMAANGWSWMTLLVEVSSDPTAMANAVRRELREIDADLPLPDVTPLWERVASSVARPRFNAFLMGMFAALSLTLAVIGVNAIMAFAVNSRTREIGVRMALGARSGHVVGRVLLEGLQLSVSGIVLGTLAALGLTRFLEGLLYDTPTFDLPTYSAVAALLAASGALAAWLPARRASRVAPRQALLAE